MTFLQKHHGQMSDSMLTAFFIILSGGLQDAYTYLFRGKVFANAQTGNIVLMATNFCEGDFAKALRYLLPLLAFAAGVYFAEGIRNRYHLMEKFHWRQLILLIEIALLFVVGFIPNNLDWLANMLVSFVCAMQVQSFRKVHGNAYASTMCIGNMRSGMDSLCSWVLNRNPAALKKSLYYWGIILLFALGAGLGSLALDLCGAKAIWFSCLLLAVSFCLMFLKEDVEEIKEDLEALEAKH